MKIILTKIYNLSDHIQPPLGLGYLANSVRPKHDVVILDSIKENIKRDDFFSYLKDTSPDMVGFQVYTYDIPLLKEYLKIAKKANKITIVGGPHPSAAPHETMTLFQEDLDFGFAGEAEIGFPLLLERLESSNQGFSDIPGLIWKEGSNIIINSPSYNQNIDQFSVAWDLIRPDEYPEAQHGAFFERFPIAPIIATRGCPFLCTFCAAHFVVGRKVRKRSIENIFEEINFLYEKYHIREFHLVDDNFTLNKKFVKNFCKKLLESNLDISWATPNGVRLDTLDKECLEIMKESGLYLISVGIESGSDRVLKMTKKELTVKKILNGVSVIKESGIDIAGFFMFGYPGETIEEMKKTIELSLKLPLIRANYFTFLPLPGTEIFNDMKKNNELDKVDWGHFYFMNAVYSSNGITRKHLKKIQRQAFLKFYSRPGIIWKNLIKIKNYRHFKFLLKRFYHWIIMS
ncbi:MAG TPA: radical SAM protein [Nitrospinota bacterium]|jgi:radical SAM superfamily enzyme YgiQ (UPF0313 family)|nr:radical SAM protein [Nitrospinota bacterium]